MSATLKPPAPMTVDEFLDWPEDPTGARWQLVDGEPVMMEPASPLHGAIQSNLGFILTAHLRAHRPGCHCITAPGIQPHARAGNNVRVPDLAVHCGSARRGEPLLNDPLMAVEILSISNRAQTWSNVWTYCSIPELREILVVHAASVMAEVLTRAEDGSWPKEFQRQGTLVTLGSIALSFPLADAYVGTELTHG
jgi:Uma2 family endonuclease